MMSPSIRELHVLRHAQAATTAIVQHPEHNELYARDPFCAGFCGAPLHALLDISSENQARIHLMVTNEKKQERSLLRHQKQSCALLSC